MVRKLKLVFLSYIFPGLALGAALGQTGVVTDGMITKSAEVMAIIIPMMAMIIPMMAMNIPMMAMIIAIMIMIRLWWSC